jgi:Tfp pilus assembly protein PilV
MNCLKGTNKALPVLSRIICYLYFTTYTLYRYMQPRLVGMSLNFFSYRQAGKQQNPEFLEGEPQVYPIKESSWPSPVSIRKLASSRAARRGSTMVEVMIAAIILVIALIGTSALFVSGRRHIINQQFYRAAAHLASQKLEELKAKGYASIAEEDVEENLSFNGVAFQRRTVTQLTAAPSADTPKPCKKATVTISWSLVNDRHQATLVTYIGP